MKKLVLGKVRYTGTNDYVAKRIWSDPNNLKNLVKKALGVDLDINDILYIQNETSGEIEAKGVRYDILIKYGSNVKIIAETQNAGNGTNVNSYSDYLINRSIHYVSNCYSTIYEIGDNYRTNKYVYIIWVCNFKIPNNKYLDVFSFSNGNILFDRIKMAFISLPNINLDATIKKEDRDFFDVINSKDLSRTNTKCKEALDVAKTIHYVNTVEDELLLAKLAELRELSYNSELEIKREEGLAEGKAKGLALGLAEGKAKGLEEGRTQGLEEGRTQGLEEGRTQGLEEGRAEGRAEGLEEGIKMANYKNAIAMYKLGVSLEAILENFDVEKEKLLELINNEQ